MNMATSGRYRSATTRSRRHTSCPGSSPPSGCEAWAMRIPPSGWGSTGLWRWQSESCWAGWSATWTGCCSWRWSQTSSCLSPRRRCWPSRSGLSPRNGAKWPRCWGLCWWHTACQAPGGSCAASRKATGSQGWPKCSGPSLWCSGWWWSRYPSSNRPCNQSSRQAAHLRPWLSPIRAAHSSRWGVSASLTLPGMNRQAQTCSCRQTGGQLPVSSHTALCRHISGPATGHWFSSPDARRTARPQGISPCRLTRLSCIPRWSRRIRRG